MEKLLLSFINCTLFGCWLMFCDNEYRTQGQIVGEYIMTQRRSTQERSITVFWLVSCSSAIKKKKHRVLENYYYSKYNWKWCGLLWPRVFWDGGNGREQWTYSGSESSLSDTAGTTLSGGNSAGLTAVRPLWITSITYLRDQTTLRLDWREEGHGMEGEWVLALTFAWVVKLQIWSSPPQAAGAPPRAGWGGWEQGWEAWWDPGWKGEMAARCSAAGCQRTGALSLVGPPSWDGTPRGPWPSWTQRYF